MNTDAKHLSAEAQIVNELGLHARSAARIAKLAAEARGGIWLAKGDQLADARGIMDILMLECPRGTMVRIIVEDPSDAPILAEVKKLIENGFGE
jgi:phosphocarrier protein